MIKSFMGLWVGIKCNKCKENFAMTDFMQDAYEHTHGDFYCAYCGFKMHYSNDPTDLELERQKTNQLKHKLEQSRRETTSALQKAMTSERGRRAEKGAKTRLKNRIKNGACPCCNRNFKNLQRHMKSKHPGYAGGSDE